MSDKAMFTEMAREMTDGRSREECVRLLAAWLDTAAQNQRNADFYRGLVVEVGEMFGEAAKTSDDGSRQDSVLALKVPELVRELLAHTAATP